MSSQLAKQSGWRNYWVAIQRTAQTSTSVFGPYGENEADEKRFDWMQRYPARAKISVVFRAVAQDEAENVADFYMPRDS